MHVSCHNLCLYLSFNETGAICIPLERVNNDSTMNNYLTVITVPKCYNKNPVTDFFLCFNFSLL